MIPILLGVTFIVFSIMALTPGDPARIMLGSNAPVEAVESLREELGLNDPFIIRYLNYIIHALQGDFGSSYRTGLPVLMRYLYVFRLRLSLQFRVLL